MRVAAINSVNYGSTGGIMLGIADFARSQGIDYFTFSSAGLNERKNVPGNEIFGSIPEEILSDTLNVYGGTSGRFNRIGTAQLIRRLEEIKPEVLHLHNLHSNDLNLAALFSFIKENDLRVVWTQHDCWAFTGKCPHFAMAGCDRWKTGCGSCPQLRAYPEFKRDNTAGMWQEKKRIFFGVKNLTLVTPSQWLADLVKDSFLGDYPVKVIHNGIDRTVFQPTESRFQEEHGIPTEKLLLLGAANIWDERKGLDVFSELSDSLGDGAQIVLVGTDDAVDARLPKNILSVRRTRDRKELAEIYSAADIFLNPTREDTFPTVNMEALACGTPVITFATGGSPEILDETCGIVTDENTAEGMRKAIVSMVERAKSTDPDTRANLKAACLKRAAAFDEKERFSEYIDLYNS